MYYIKGSNKIYGPFSFEKVQQLLAEHKISWATKVSKDQQTWNELQKFSEFLVPTATQNPAVAVNGNNVPTSNSASSSKPSTQTLSLDFLQQANSGTNRPLETNNSFAQPQVPQPQFSIPSQPIQQPMSQVGVPSIPVPEDNWFLSNDGANGFGPYPTSQVVAMIQNGQVLARNLAWRNGETAVQISMIPTFAGYFQNYSNMPMSNGYTNSRRMPHGTPLSRTTYVLLALFFGCFGVHNFYAGYTTNAVIQLISSICCVGLFFVPIWTLIEACTVTVDARGIPFE